MSAYSMGRGMRTDPAVCPMCQTDFESSGKYRYHNLKNHMKNVHGVGNTNVYSNIHTIINNTYSNCNINNNITINVNIDGTIASREDMEKLITESVRRSLDGLISENDSVIVKLFDTLHCNPAFPSTHVAAIPNKKKDEMLVVNKNGAVNILTKDDGALVIMDKIKNESKLVDDVTDDMMGINKSVVNDMTDSMIKETIGDIITHIENLPKNERRVTENILRDRRKSAMRESVKNLKENPNVF